jgi:hypothetical protein
MINLLKWLRIGSNGVLCLVFAALNLRDLLLSFHMLLCFGLHLGCGKKRSDESMGTLVELSPEPAVEDLSRKILSETKLWEAIQEARAELLRRRQEQVRHKEQLLVPHDGLVFYFLLLWNPKIQSRYHKSSPLDPLLNQFNPVHIFSTSCLRLISILSSHLHLGLLSAIFPSEYTVRVCMSCISYLYIIRSSCPF